MRFLYNKSAILHRNAIIIGDVHFGMEERLREEGIYDEMLSERIFNDIKKLILKTRAKKLIIAGDVKDNILELDWKTLDILRRLSQIASITIIKGNHDGGIEKCETSGITIAPADGIVYEKIGIMHGHSWPNENLMKCNYLISAHQHPQVAFIDRSGRIHKEAVWLVAEPDRKNIKKHYKMFNERIRLVMMPAFNPLVGSTINIRKEKQLGPVFNNKLFKLNDALVIRLDGCLVGKLKDINIKE
jgi:putative SbcD/Mre11-related phosphoesterase